MYENKAAIEEKNNYYDIPASSKLMTFRILCNSLGSHFGIIMPTLVNLTRAKLYKVICPMQPRHKGTVILGIWHILNEISPSH